MSVPVSMTLSGKSLNVSVAAGVCLFEVLRHLPRVIFRKLSF